MNGAVRNPAASLASGKGSARPTLEPELNKWEPVSCPDAGDPGGPHCCTQVPEIKSTNAGWPGQATHHPVLSRMSWPFCRLALLALSILRFRTRSPH